MHLFRLMWAYLRAKPLATVLHLLMVILGIATLTALILINAQVSHRLDRDVAGIDMVVGAKGSPMQLILSSVFQVDSPTGNIPGTALEDLRRNPMVKEVIPIAMGDNIQGFRIVGTDAQYPAHYHATLSDGKLFANTMQATLGAEVASNTSLKVGDTFKGSHGLVAGGEQHENTYTVVGIFNRTNTVVDRLALTPVSSVWEVHAHHHHHDDDDHEEDDHDEDDDEHKHEAHSGDVTAALVKFRNPAAFARLPRMVNETTNMQAAVLAQEAARLFSVFGVGVAALQTVAVLLLITAALSLFVALSNALNERKYDLALLRTLGAKPAGVFSLLVAEALAIGLLGSVLGVALGHGLVALLPLWLGEAHSLILTPFWFECDELYLILGMAVLALLASFAPAWRAYRMNLSEVLKTR